MTEIPLCNLIDLAVIGAKFVRQEHQKNIIHWLGELPTESEIKKAGELFRQQLPGADIPDYSPFVEVA